MFEDRKLDHIGLAVTDAARGAAWYQDVLGYKLLGKFKDNCGKDVFFVGNADSSVIYEIYTEEDMPEILRGKVDHISLFTDDVEKDYQYCLSRGYTITTEGIESIPTFWEKGIRYFKILSATGEQVEFCQIL